MIAGEDLESFQEVGRAGLLLGVRLGVRVDQAEIEAAFEERPGEALLLPVLLARALGDFPGLELGRQLVLFRHDLLLASKGPVRRLADHGSNLIKAARSGGTSGSFEGSPSRRQSVGAATLEGGAQRNASISSARRWASSSPMSMRALR